MPPEQPQLQAKVGGFVGSGIPCQVKAQDTQEMVAPQQQAGGRQGVDDLRRGAWGCGRRQDRHTPIRVDQPAGIQQRAVGLHQPGAGGADRVVRVQRLHERREPARRHERRAIQQADIAPPRRLDADVVGFAEIAVAAERDHLRERRFGLQSLDLAGGAAIVDEDDFVPVSGGVLPNMLQADQRGVARVAVVDDDRHLGRDRVEPLDQR